MEVQGVSTLFKSAAVALVVGVASIGLASVRHLNDSETETTVRAEAVARERAALGVAPSTISAAGQGLFAKRAFRRGEVVCELAGRVVPWPHLLTRRDDTYTLQLSPFVYVDAKDNPEVLARFINDNADRLRLNLAWRKQPAIGRAEAIALRDISAGEELFVSYGQRYWKGRDGPKTT